MSSATTDSMTWIASRLFSRPCVRLWRTPVTTTVSTSSVGGVCAAAVAEMESAATANAVLADAELMRLLSATWMLPRFAYYSDKC